MRSLSLCLGMVRGGRAARLTFWVFAAVLFTLTHWPALKVPSPVPRTDILMHMGFFGTWTVLCAACCWFGPFLSTRNIVRVGLLSVVYAAVDEGLQAIPIIQRQCGWDDFGADVLGVLAATALLLILSRAVSKYDADRGVLPSN